MVCKGQYVLSHILKSIGLVFYESGKISKQQSTTGLA